MFTKAKDLFNFRPRRPRQSNLVNHARAELERIGEDKETTEGILKIVQAFADMGHSGGSASVAIPMINALLQFRPLGPLTNDPGEWQEISREMSGGEDLWQNRRDGRAFSHDAGNTYYLVDDKARQIHYTRMSAKIL